MILLSWDVYWGLSGRLICVLFSPCREKSTKRAPRKGGPHGASLTEPTTCARDPFAIGVAKGADRAEDRGHPIARTNGGAPSALSSPETRRRKRKFLAYPREQVCPASSALRRGCGLPATREVIAHKAFLPLAKRQRRTGDRIRKERTWVLSLRGDSFGTFLSPRKEKYAVPSPR